MSARGEEGDSFDYIIVGAGAFLRPAERRPNLTICTGAMVSPVMVEKERAQGVAFRSRGRDRRVTATREVILSAGALACEVP